MKYIHNKELFEKETSSSVSKPWSRSQTWIAASLADTKIRLITLVLVVKSKQHQPNKYIEAYKILLQLM